MAPCHCVKDEIMVNVKAASVHILDAQICGGYGRSIRRRLCKYFKVSVLLLISNSVRKADMYVYHVNVFDKRQKI